MSPVSTYHGHNSLITKFKVLNQLVSLISLSLNKNQDRLAYSSHCLNNMLCFSLFTRMARCSVRPSPALPLSARRAQRLPT